MRVAAVQHDIGDGVRGRVFALYDTLFNIAQVVAVTVAAAVAPLDGRSPGLVLAATVFYLIGLTAYLVLLARQRQAQHARLVGEDDRGHSVG